MKFIKVTVLSSFLSPEGEKKMIGIGDDVKSINKKDQHGLYIKRQKKNILKKWQMIIKN